VVSGNYIGTDYLGTAALPNQLNGVSIWGGSKSNTIGQPENIIAFNNGSGVAIGDDDTIYNKVSRNSMHSNVGLGIDLINNANMEIAAPAIMSAIIINSTLHLEGVGAGANATVKIFKADSLDSGEGMLYLANLVADADGNFMDNVSVVGLSVGDPVTCTTTYVDDNTSEFSIPVTALSPTQSTEELSNAVDNIGLNNGTENSLTSSLENASDAIERGDNDAAIGQLGAFINRVKAQRGKKISKEEADLLIAWAESVIAALQGEVAPAPAKKGPFGPKDKLMSKWGKIKTK